MQPTRFVSGMDVCDALWLLVVFCTCTTVNSLVVVSSAPHRTVAVSSVTFGSQPPSDPRIPHTSSMGVANGRHAGRQTVMPTLADSRHR
jgi:hypothetical protein